MVRTILEITKKRMTHRVILFCCFYQEKVYSEEATMVG